MLILSRVCAEFRDRNGAVIFRVTPATRHCLRLSATSSHNTRPIV